jgi:hypothetical protein
MTDSTAAELPRRKRKGPGTGKPAPAVVLNGTNVIPEVPLKKWEPTLYTPDLADRICEWLSNGKSLRSFCLQEGTPKATTVVRWTREDAEFAVRYARARDEGFDRLAELTRDVANDTSIAPEDVQRAKLGFDANRWYLSKVAHRRYGDRLDVRQEISGPGGGPIAVDVLTQVLLAPAVLDRLSDAQVEALRSAIPLLAVPIAAARCYTQSVALGLIMAFCNAIAAWSKLYCDTGMIYGSYHWLREG